MAMHKLDDMKAEVEADRAAMKRAQMIRVRSRSNSAPGDSQRRYDQSTSVVAVMTDGTEVELTSVVTVRWEHKVGNAPVVVVELIDVEIEADAPAVA